MELEVPVVAGSIISFGWRKKTKTNLKWFEESGSIEQDADIVAFLYRDDYYNRDNAIMNLQAKVNLL